MHLWASRFAAKGSWKIYHEIVECPSTGSVAERVASGMDSVVANSQSIGREMTQLLDPVPVRIIPFLTAIAPMIPPAKRFRVPERTLRIAFLGRLVSHKRPDRLIEAWPAWIARGPIGPARLDLYGGASDDKGRGLQAQIAALGLQESIRVHGAYTTKDLPKIFDATDIVVLLAFRLRGIAAGTGRSHAARNTFVVATSAGVRLNSAKIIRMLSSPKAPTGKSLRRVWN